MKKFITIIVSLYISTSMMAQVQKKETAHFTSKYPLEVEAYALASLEILESVWMIATDSGFYLPQKIRFSMEKSDRNALYYHRKNLRAIIWEYEDLSEFLPPEKSQKNNIYGLCHEMGHLCMYNTNHNRNSWMSYDYREAWADYFGNMIVDRLYKEQGMDIWPQPHDYTRYAGMVYFLHRLEQNDPKLRSFNNGGLFWHELGSELGFSNIQKFFNSLNTQKVDNPNAAVKFTKVLATYMVREDMGAWFQAYAGDLILNKE